MFPSRLPLAHGHGVRRLAGPLVGNVAQLERTIPTPGRGAGGQAVGGAQFTDGDQEHVPQMLAPVAGVRGQQPGGQGVLTVERQIMEMG
jgi:hypothetical protein